MRQTFWLFSSAALMCGLLNASDAPVILVLGAPGSGKTVNAKRISERYGIPAISMAALLKEAGGWGKAGSRKTFRESVESGELVNDELAIGLLEQRLGKIDVSKGFVLDGFPLTTQQAAYLEDLGRRWRLAEPVVLHLTIPDSMARDRMRKRGRADDKPAIIERRLAEYHAQARWVLGRYPRVVTIDASGTREDVWRSVEQALDALLQTAQPNSLGF